ncbi:hypothetical protein [Stutzerimonas stutzeri]|nr:hypothetical protein [Stutzerimonas stutzeri]
MSAVTSRREKPSKLPAFRSTWFSEEIACKQAVPDAKSLYDACIEYLS